MTSATNHATLSRTTSACSLPISLSTNSTAVILPFSAIVVLLHPSICERTDDSEAHGGRPTSGPARRARYTTSTDLTRPEETPASPCARDTAGLAPRVRESRLH